MTGKILSSSIDLCFIHHVRFFQNYYKNYVMLNVQYDVCVLDIKQLEKKKWGF